MNNVLSKISEIIIGRTKEDYYLSNIKNNLNNFLNSNLTYEQKTKCIEQLYLLVLYKDGYLSADPRYKRKVMHDAVKVLEEKKIDLFESNFDLLKQVVDKLKAAETNPLNTYEKMINDSINHKGDIF